jgi:hypothetical protein
MTAIFSAFRRKPGRLRLRQFEAERRRFLSAWQDDVRRMSAAEINVEISATHSAMRQIAELVRGQDEEASDV